MKCPITVCDSVVVQAEVKVAPNVNIGKVKYRCVGRPRIRMCSNKSNCTYVVSQLICVCFPLSLSAAATAEPSGIICDEPDIKQCDSTLHEE